MGNCLRRPSSTQWAGDDWGTSDTRAGGKGHVLVRNHRQKDGFITASSAIAMPTKSQEVKVKITKKQLEELLGRVDVKELSVQQVLAHLITATKSKSNEANQRCWRPTLQSIPES